MKFNKIYNLFEEILFEQDKKEDKIIKLLNSIKEKGLELPDEVANILAILDAQKEEIPDELIAVLEIIESGEKLPKELKDQLKGMVATPDEKGKEEKEPEEKPEEKSEEEPTEEKPKEESPPEEAPEEVPEEELSDEEKLQQKMMENFERLGSQFIDAFKEVLDEKFDVITRKIRNVGIEETLRDFLENYFIKNLDDKNDKMFLVINELEFIPYVMQFINEEFMK